VLTVQGRYPDARADCARLARVAREIYAMVCDAAVDSVTGKAAQAMNVLVRAQSMPGLDRASREYADTMQGEIAHRLGDDSAGDRFAAGLRLDPNDLYAIGAYCDWLLDQGRPQDVLPLVIDHPRVDPLLLRLALAQQALSRPQLSETIGALRARFDASRARGDTVHRREEARFELHLHRNAQTALALARENWEVQREPADLRILVEAAVAARDADTIDMAKVWLKDSGLEYRAVDALLDRSGELQ
jgi:hypothetical protein